MFVVGGLHNLFAVSRYCDGLILPTVAAALAHYGEYNNNGNDQHGQ